MFFLTILRKFQQKFLCVNMHFFGDKPLLYTETMQIIIEKMENIASGNCNIITFDDTLCRILHFCLTYIANLTAQDYQLLTITFSVGSCITAHQKMIDLCELLSACMQAKHTLNWLVTNATNK